MFPVVSQTERFGPSHAIPEAAGARGAGAARVGIADPGTASAQAVEMREAQDSSEAEESAAGWSWQVFVGAVWMAGALILAFRFQHPLMLRTPKRLRTGGGAFVRGALNSGYRKFPSSGKDLVGSGTAGNQGRVNLFVESEESGIMIDCQGKEVEIGYLFRTHISQRREGGGIEQGNVIRKKTMAKGPRYQLPKEACRTFRGARSFRVGGMTQNSGKPIFGKGAGAPARSPVLGKPAHGLGVIGMRRVDACN